MSNAEHSITKFGFLIEVNEKSPGLIDHHLVHVIMQCE